MIPRTLENILSHAATHYPVVTLTGPRQSGKTTLIRSVFSNYDYVSLEDPEQRGYAIEDPRGFLEQFPDNVIFDEVQRVPDLFSYIQIIVDENDRPGQFLLTGSQNFLLLKSISQSLAGRCSIHHLLPFSMAEIMQWPDIKLKDIGRKVPEKRKKPDISLFDILHTGFFPRIHDKKIPAHSWLENYTQTYIERDVRDIINVGDLETFRRFIGLCAGRAGQLLNLSSLAADVGITHTTARRWLSILQTSFVVTLLPSYHKNFNKRLVKSPKLYFFDTGLLCYLLRIRQPEDLALHAARGAIFENFIVAEVFKRAFHSGERPDLFFWRDSAGHEIDLIVDSGAGQMPVEIKSGKTIAADFFKGLDYFRKISGEKQLPGMLCYGGDRSFRKKNTMVCPWWNF